VRVLVTGAGGYLGGAVTGALRAAGHEPLPFAGDVTDAAAARDAVAGVAGVVHLAALSRVREAAADPARCHAVNTGGTRVVLAAAAAEARRRAEPVRFVFTSTAAVYGAATPPPIPESAPLAPLGPYAESKAGAERAVGAAVRDAAGGLVATVLRVFNAAGATGGRADGDPTRLVPRVLRVAAGEEPYLEVYGDGRAVRDYVHVADVADAAVRALAGAGEGAPRVFNVGATPASVLDVAAAAERVTGRPVTVVHRAGNPGEAPDLRADTTALRAALGWSPSRSDLDTMVAGQWTARSRAGEPPGPR
jgi:UDP-glucose 4-epimerase